MKKEKTIRTYQRRTKSGKVVTVRQHTASYDAAEKLREMAKKKGAGKELEDRKSKGMPDPSLPLEQYLDELSKRKKGSEAEDSADVSKEAKKGAEKKTTKKVRSVGSGTKVDKQTKAWFNSSPSSFSKVKVSKDKFGWRIDLSDGSGQVYDSKEAAQKDAKLLRGMYKEWKGSSKGPNGSTPTKTSMKTTSASASSPAFTAAEFKEWYRGTGSAADKKVAKALRAQLGRAGYRKLEDEAIDGYSARGHLSMFKRVSGGSGVKTSKSGAKETSTKTSESKANVPTKRSAETIYSAKADSKRPIDDPFKRARLIEVLRNKGKGEFNRVQMIDDFKEYFSRKGGWTPSVKGKELLKEAKREFDQLKTSKKRFKNTSGKPSSAKTAKRKGPMVASGPDDFKSFLKSPKPEKGSKGYAVHMALRSVARAGIGTDDSIRDALVRNGYPKDKAYSKGVKEVVALAKKHGLRL